MWPTTVHVFGPESADITSTIRDLFADQDLYDTRRQALLFKPGVYDLDVPVGYYTTVHGLGTSPENVTISGQYGIHEAEEGDNLIKFWRSAENLVARPASGKMVWSVSQASPLRRMIIDGDLHLGAEADTKGSGGFAGNLKVTGRVDFTMQQQWVMRNCEIGDGTSYFQDPPRSVNFVYVGTAGAPTPTAKCTDSATNRISPRPQELVQDATPVSMEKPYITIDPEGKYSLVTPEVVFDTVGVQWDSAAEFTDGFEHVFVADNATGVEIINSKLAVGLHVILSPGIYLLPKPIRIGRAASTYQVLLGLGLPTLVPMHGGPAVEVGDAPGVRVAGILLEAGPVESAALITVGATEAAGKPAKPILLADVFARVGGPGTDPRASRLLMEVNASNVILDNVWLWRADVRNVNRSHDCQHGLIVNGRNVTAYGLASEHFQSDNVVWNGEGGRVYFYQAELDGWAHNPLDKTLGYGPDGVSGYRVNAKEHLGIGIGVYCYFTRPGVVVESGVKVRHPETMDTIICPFVWVWENENTLPKGNSTIRKAIMLDGQAMI